jgi:hypothetical protein
MDEYSHLDWMAIVADSELKKRMQRHEWKARTSSCEVVWEAYRNPRRGRRPEELALQEAFGLRGLDLENLKPH